MEEKIIKEQSIIWYLLFEKYDNYYYKMLLIGSVGLIWGLNLYNETLVSSMFYGIIQFGCPLGVTVCIYFYLIITYSVNGHYKVRLFMHIFYFLFFYVGNILVIGGLLSFSLFGLNKYFINDNLSQNIICQIDETRVIENAADNKVTEVVILYNNFKKKIFLPSKDFNELKDFKKVNLNVKEGFLGYFIINEVAFVNSSSGPKYK